MKKAKSRKKFLGLLLAGAMIMTTLCGVSGSEVSAKSTKSAKSSKTSAVYLSAAQDHDYAKKLLKCINKKRTENGLKAVSMDKTLSKDSVTRAAEIVIYFPETSPIMRPNGKRGSAINKKFCYEACAQGSDMSASWVVNQWMKSKSRMKGLLSKKVKSVGIGCLEINGVYYVCADFSTSKANKKVTASGKETVTRKVSALNKYLQSGCFKLSGKKNLTVGKTAKLTVRYSGKTTETKKMDPVFLMAKSFKWTSSKPSVAAVSSKGVVTAKKSGTVKITAALKGNAKIKKTIKIHVTAK